MLQVNAISQTYEGLPVLQDVSFSLDKGEHLAILGPSGCGKSTLLKILVGLDHPTHGSIHFKGNPILGCGQLALMGQEDWLLPWKTLIQNAAIPLKLKGLRDKDAYSQARSFLKDFGLDGFGDYFPYQLSGGMKQRAALLRTYLASPELLLLDEPFAALDAISRRKMQSWLSRILEIEGSTLILVTHSLEEALLVAHRVIVLSNAPGKIVLDLPLSFSSVPMDEKEFLPEFLSLKKKILHFLGQEMNIASP